MRERIARAHDQDRTESRISTSAQAVVENGWSGWLGGDPRKGKSDKEYGHPAKESMNASTESREAGMNSSPCVQVSLANRTAESAHLQPIPTIVTHRMLVNLREIRIISSPF
jgi:hypothetical protein